MTLPEALTKLRRSRYVAMRREMDSEGEEFITACVYEVPGAQECDEDMPGRPSEDRVLAGISAALNDPRFETLLIGLIEHYA